MLLQATYTPFGTVFMSYGVNYRYGLCSSLCFLSISFKFVNFFEISMLLWP